MRNGIVAENVEPAPSSLCNPALPPSNSASCLLSDRPRPVPRRRFRIGESTWVKSVKITEWNFGSMPMPLSVTANVMLPSVFSRADTRTSPLSVNFSALEMKLRRIWDSFLSSVNRREDCCGSSKTSVTSWLVSTGRNMPRSAENRSTISNQAGEISTRPASTLASSSRSLTMPANSSAVDSMKLTCLSCSSFSGPSTRSSRRPDRLRMAEIGVRNSWLM